MSARILTLILVASAIVGACAPAAGPAATDDGTATPPTPSPAALTPVPTTDGSQVVVPSPFEPPAPVCPAPPLAPQDPRLTVSAGDGPAVDATLLELSILTCSTARSDEFPPVDPSIPIPVEVGGTLTWSVQPGWGILAWEAWDAPRGAEGVNVVPLTETPDRPLRVEVTVGRDVDTIVGVRLWLSTDDGRATAQISGSAWADVP